MKAHKDKYYLYGAFFLIVFGAKVYLIGLYGNATPYWDQWDAEAFLLYKPWLDGYLSLADLFATHNEHRIATTRILALALFELNGGVWSPLVQMYVNAFIHSGTLLLLLALLTQEMGRTQKNILFTIAGALYLSPFSWENTLAGFQSQFYFLLLFGLLFLWSMASARTYSPYWWLGVFTGALGAVSMASGAIALVAGSIILALRRLVFQEKDNVHAGASLVPLTLAIISIYLTPDIEGHSKLHASGFLDLILAFGATLVWPSHATFISIFIMQVPAFFLAVSVLFNSALQRSVYIFFGGMYLWYAGQCLAIAYGRSNAAVYASRYLDILVVGVILGIFACLTLTSRSSPNNRLAAYAGTTIWLMMVAVGMWSQSDNISSSIKSKHLTSLIQEENVRGYLCTRDNRFLYNKQHLEIPYPNPDRLKFFLDDPTIVSFLPNTLKAECERYRQVNSD